MYKKSDFKVGETLFCPLKERHHLPYEIQEYKIEKIGNKY